MKRILIAVALLLGVYLVTPLEAQGRFWVLVNGAMRYTGIVQVFGTFTDVVNGIAVTSTDAETVQNTTPATAGVTVQMSPRTKWCGAGYNSVSTLSETDCYFWETLPATVAGTTTAQFKMGVSINAGAATYPFVITNAGVASFGPSTGGSVLISGAGTFKFNTQTIVASPADGLTNITNSGPTFGLQVNVGTATPTVTSCGTGSITAHSTNTAGGFTATGATSCTVTFGVPNWTNVPFCTVSEITTAGVSRISAASVSAFTVTGFTSGDAFYYHCLGGTQ